MGTDSLIKSLRGEGITCGLTQGQSTSFEAYLADPQILSKLSLFMDHLQIWNAKMNLVGKATMEKLIERHLLDSLCALTIVTSVDLPEGPFLDVGSGAGFPGMIWAICEPKRTMFLLEPRLKRAIFLKEAARKLELSSVVVLDKRLEQISGEISQKYLSPKCLALSITRATGLREVFLNASNPLLEVGGVAVEMTGVDRDGQESCTGYERPDRFLYRIGAERIEHAVVVRRKAGLR